MDFVINKNTHQKLYPVSIGLGVIKILFETPWTTSTISLTYNSLVFDFLLDYIILVSGIYPMFIFYQPLSTSTRLRMCLSYYSKSRRVFALLYMSCQTPLPILWTFLVPSLPLLDTLPKTVNLCSLSALA